MGKGERLGMLKNGPYKKVDNPKRLTVIVGVARSGTSLCSLMFKHSGFNMFGKKWFDDEVKNETAFAKQCREYVLDKKEPAEIREHRKNKTKEMNRSGFWEDPRFSVCGLNYNLETRGLIYDIQTSDRPPVGKIVCQGLPNTDPALIGQIIYTMRNPHKVAKSQEKLRRGPERIVHGLPVDVTEEIKIHTPEMYIRTTYQACRWLVANPQIPVFFYDYDDLLDDPKTVLMGMDKFLKEHISEDMDKHNIDIVKAGLEVIEPSSRRSGIEDIPNDLWGEAEFIYDKFREGAAGNKQAFTDIIEYMEKIDEREIHKQARQWFCYRANVTVNEEICSQCRLSPSNFIKSRVESLRYTFIEWDKEPCMAECGESLNIPEDQYITIAESIENNFWIDAVKDLMDIPADQINGNLIHEPFMKKWGPGGEQLMHEIDDKNADRIVKHLCAGVPTGMLAKHLAAKEGELVNFLRDKFGRFHLSYIMQRQRESENYRLLNFKYQIKKHVDEEEFTSEQQDDFNLFLEGLLNGT